MHEDAHTSRSRQRHADGATFDFTTKTWTTIPLPDAAALPDAHRAGTANAWIGDRFYVWGGTGSDVSVDSSGAVFDPATRTWSAMPSGGPHAANYSENIGSPMNEEALFWAETMMIYCP